VRVAALYDVHATPTALEAVLDGLGDDVEFRRTPFDVGRTSAEIKASGWPRAESFVAENLRAAPSRAEATEHMESLA
jgi:hypothetical protein